MTTPRTSPHRARLAGAAALSALTALVAGIPTLLLTISAAPVPARGFTWEQLTAPDDGTLALSAVTVIAWLAWALLTVLVGLDVISRIRDVPCPRLPGLATPQALTHGLVGAALLLLTPTAAPPVAPPAPSAASVTLTAGGLATPAAHPPAAATREAHERTHTVRAGESLWSIARDELGDAERWRELADLNDGHYGPDHTIYTGTVLHLPPSVPDGSTYTVRRGDTLTGIAQDHLGDPDRYPDIFTASRRTTQPDGRHLTDPDLIVTGWHLTIPADPATSAQKSSAASAHDAESPERAARPQHDPPRPTLRDVNPAPQRPSRTTPTDTPATNDTAAARDSIDAPWVLTGLTGGSLLVGALWLTLRRRRAAQFRHRRPGRTPATPDPVLAPVEKTLAAFGPSAVPDLEQLDLALRRLARHLSGTGQPLPTLAAIELTPAGITAHLETPAHLPAPWRDLGGGTRWVHPTGPEASPMDRDGELDDQPAPYPLLVTLGTSDPATPWLFNCEDLAVTLTGDPTYAQDFARYLAAEIASNPWSAGVTLDCVGLAAEVAAMNPDRLRAHPTGSDAAADVLADAVATIDRAGDHAGDAVTARAAQSGADTWPARMLLLDPATATTPALTQLLDLLRTHPGATATGVVLTGRTAHPGTVTIVFTPAGRVRVPHAGLDLVAVGLTPDEAAGCAALLTAGADLDDQEMPTSEDDGWHAFTDAAGALRPEHTDPRDSHPAGGADHASLLHAPDQAYLQAGATTPADLAALAPHVPATVHPELTAADPTLDADLASWHDQNCPLPRLTLLGPVKARTRGRALTERKAYMTAVLAYLATRPHGATPDELAEAMGITPAKARGYAKIVRDWLGPNPRTGTTHLPDARHAPSALARGVPVYEVQDLLVDADLFRRLRARGQARGSDGIPDLISALKLVSGRPFDQLRPGAWSWLYDGDRLDQHLLCAVVDVAHIVTTHALQSGDAETARATAELAAAAAPDEDRPLLDLAAVADAEGRRDEAQTILRDHVLNRADDETTAPSDLPARSDLVIRNRRWTGGQAAS